jgi:ribonuclease D
VTLPPHDLITTPNSWKTCLHNLQIESRLAIDLEANSMFAYREQVCLIQISIPEQDYIIDPLCGLDLTGLGEIIANPAVEKIFHAAEYDLTLLKAEYGWELQNLFDTMWAARILGYSQYGLANILGNLFGVKLDKKYQKSNWCKRPLAPAQLIYAQLDTHYLLRLRDHLAQELRAGGHEAEAAETFRQQTQVAAPDYAFDPDSFWSINGVNELTRQQQAILKALHIYRDQEASFRNKPLFKIFHDKTLVQLAAEEPRHLSQLRHVYGMSEGQIRRYGRILLQIIEKAQNDPQPSYPKRGKRPSDQVIARYDTLHNWRKLRARKRGVESDVIVSRNALWALAHANPHSLQDLTKIEELGGWHRETYGQEILKLLHK